jgi:hypothetical protein
VFVREMASSDRSGESEAAERVAIILPWVARWREDIRDLAACDTLLTESHCFVNSEGRSAQA